MACREEARRSQGKREDESAGRYQKRYKKDVSLSSKFYVSLSCLVFSQSSVLLNSRPELRISA